MLRFFATSIVVAAAWIASVSAAAVDSIILKSVVRMPVDATEVLLRDVAYLEGDEAARLATTVIATLGERAELEVSLEEIRQKLASAGARWAVIDLSGRAVRIRAAGGSRPLAMRGMAIDASQAPRIVTEHHEGIPGKRHEFFASDAAGEPTPRGLIAELLQNVHAAKGTRVRIVVEGIDAALLDDRDPRRRYEVVPLNSLSANRVLVRIITRDGDTVLGRVDVPVTPTLEATVAVTTRSFRRGSTLDADSVRVEEAWVDPTEFARLAPATTLNGAQTMDSIAEGTRLRQDHIRRATEIRRNDRVTVRRELGGIAIELAAIAMDEGAVGDRIRLQSVDRKDRRGSRSFTAVVVGPGRAVLREDA